MTIKEKKHKVILIDDHPIYLQGLELALKDSFYLDVMLTFTSSQEAIKYINNHKVDIILCDINMPEHDGFDLLTLINKKLDIRVLFISGLKDDFTITRAYKAGAYGYITKEAPLLDIFKALDTIRKGEKYITPEINSILLKGATSKVTKPLTKQETVILQKICEEKNSEQIALDLSISINTVNNHRKSILQKTNSVNLVSLTKYAARNGLLT